MYDSDTQIDFKTLRYVLYARKSTDDPKRQVRSIPDQIDECKQLAQRLGLNVVDTFREEKSAKRPNIRPVFTKVVEDIKAGKYDAILAWNPDRLARNMLEAGMLIDLADSKIIKDFKFVTHIYSPDANGKMLLGMAFVLSKQYSDKLSQDVTRGVRKKFEEGKSPIHKHGYIRDDHGIYRPDEVNDRFAIIQSAWYMRADGKSLEEINEYVNQKGYYRLTESTKQKQYMTFQKLSTIFKDSFYYGALVQAGQTVFLPEIYDFEPMVDRDTYDKVQSLILDRYIPYKSKLGTFYPLKQMVKCDYCQSNMVVAPSSGHLERYLYYRCDNVLCVRNSAENRAKNKKDPTYIKASVRSLVLFEFIYELLKDGLNLTEKEYIEYKDSLKKLGDNDREKIRSEIEQYEAQRRNHIKEAKRIGLALGKLTENKTAYQINADELAKQKTKQSHVEATIAELRTKLTDEEEDELSLEEFLNLSKNAATTVKAGDAIAKDLICRLLFLNFSLGNEKVASYQLKEPFDTLLKSRSFRNGRGERN